MPHLLSASSQSVQNTFNQKLKPSLELIRLKDFRTNPVFSRVNGQGSSIVVIDTGIDLNHPLFGPDKNRDGVADRIVYSYDFSGDNDPDAYNPYNAHGSNVTSIAAAIAPDAKIIHLKVFPDPTNLNGDAYDTAEALQWVVDHAAEYNISSVNISLGGQGSNLSTETPHPISGKQLAALANKGVAVITAAGNSFYELGSKLGVTDYSADPNTISVGAVWSFNSGKPRPWVGGSVDKTIAPDRIISFSQRDPKLLDILAPGGEIVGADQNGGLDTSSGTSQAAPFISGVIALAQQLALQELGRRLKVQELRYLLQVSGKTITDTDDRDRNDNVRNTGLNFKRVDVFGLGEAILTARLGVFPTAQNDRIIGSRRSDYIAGFDGNDNLGGGDGHDTLQGGVGNDILSGGTGKDTLNGQEGNDDLYSGADNDILIGGGGQDYFVVRRGDGKDAIADFTGVGRGVNPLDLTVSEVDTLKFEGAGFTANQLLLTQSGKDTLISFEGVTDTQIYLKNVRLDTLDNISSSIASYNLANILFDKQSSPQDSFDVLDADSTQTQVFNPNTVTFLNDLDNQVAGFDDSNDVINGQRGNDQLYGLSGDDVLRGGAGNDILVGGEGSNTLTGDRGRDAFVVAKEGYSYVTDFILGQDSIKLADGLTLEQLKIEQDTGNYTNRTWIKLASDDSLLMSLAGVQTSGFVKMLNSSSIHLST